MGGGDFLKNPKGLNLLFCKPGTYLCSLFFILFFCFRSSIFLWKSDFFCFGVGVVLQGFQILGLDKKLKINYKRFCPAPKFETLAALFDFLWCLEVFSMQKLVFSCFGDGKHLKKTMQILPSELAVAKASVCFFDLLVLIFRLLFGCWCFTFL